MTEYKLFEGDIPEVSTYKFHEHRERAPHLEQDGHKLRLRTAAQLVQDACLWEGEACSVVDLGCGDGGLLSVVQDFSCVSRAWGYDFTPANEEGWRERGVTAYLCDVFGKGRPTVELGRITVMTEVLEHLADPHAEVRWVAQESNFLVASSPYDETADDHDACHAWAWDREGYRALIEQGGFRILYHHQLNWKFQVVLAVREGYEA